MSNLTTNDYWKLLAATINELSLALETEGLSTEERLDKIRAIRDFCRSRLGDGVPSNVHSEYQERRVHEDEKILSEREFELAAQGTRLGYKMDDTGRLHEYIYTPDEDEGPLTDEEIAIMLAERSENTDDR